jgi:hypothetical protein
MEQSEHKIIQIQIRKTLHLFETGKLDQTKTFTIFKRLKGVVPRKLRGVDVYIS